MKKILIISVLIFLIDFPPTICQQVPVFSFKQIEPLLHKQNDTLYLINFWATWCKPCVQELSGIEQVASDFSDKKFKVILVSLDFVNALNNRLIPYINKNNIQSNVILLNDPDSNKWIDKVDSSWSGAIPASLIYIGNKREFYEKSFTYDELKLLIQNKIKNQ